MGTYSTNRLIISQMNDYNLEVCNLKAANRFLIDTRIQQEKRRGVSKYSDLKYGNVFLVSLFSLKLLATTRPHGRLASLL